MSCSAYLNQYGLVSRPPPFLRHPWDHFITVPLAGEPDGGRAALDRLVEVSRGQGRVLLVLVLNRRPSATQAAREGNARTREWVQGKTIGIGWQLAERENTTIALWDWAGERCFKEDEGVGLARRLGADLGAALFNEGHLRSSHLFTTDGDALVPPSYLTAPLGPQLGGHEVGEATAVFPFSHDSDRSHRLYDLYLRYHPAGLAFAGSPFAFPPIGSTLRIPIRSYCAARGFPQRLAGEDFHLLNKLAKLGPVHQMDSAPLRLTGRPSDRVPFGTGPATARLEDRQLYLDDPRIYRVLGELVRWAKHSCDKHAPLTPAFSADWDTEQIRNFVGISELAERAMRVAWDSRTTPEDRWRHWWTHFDGLRTYQWVRRMRKVFPPIPFPQALEEAPFPLETVCETDLEEGLSLEGALPHWRGDNRRSPEL